MEVKEQTVSKRAYLVELQEEVKAMEQSGTTYRKATAKFALEVAAESLNPYEFFDRGQAYQKVKNKFLFSGMDSERMTDVSETLFHIIRDLDKKLRQKPEQKRLLEQRKKQLKPFSLKFVPGKATSLASENSQTSIAN